ncbi:O-succinylbenzoic acid--CoA ligase [Salinimicrobium marinum]|uniref:O-succinylbenzoic acid--CoA ligase n=1 Tax=Salinimicrobium marinum TaxID=680283 RepID=A0A918SEH2_9FLAO|nr:AMP-binding protein [Salinimicrobium marinum]GHA37526.1 O-succinylbenzoic acid--CoA ligase [Salinimicrobium marinum]
MEKTFTLPEIHPDFKLNKKHYNNQDLAAVAYNLIKEGEPYEGRIGTFLLDWLNDQEYIAVKTSGSTGTPKKIRIKKEFMVNSALATGKFFDLPSKSTALHCLPADYIAGKMMLVRAMVLGWDIDTVPPKANALDQVFKIYDFCAMTPFQLDNSLSRLHLIRKLIVGGGSVSANLKKLVQGLETKIYETYGMTETVTHIAARRINPKKEKEHPIPFKVLPNVSISTNERGCLIIEAPKVAEGKLVTNDVAEIVKKKKFLLKGRYDNVINSGGIKLHPEQIEAKLEAIIAHRFFVTSLPDDALGEKLILMVESDFSEEALRALEREIRDFRMLEKYEVPKKIYFVGKFEETPNGKIHRGNTLKSRIS